MTNSMHKNYINVFSPLAQFYSNKICISKDLQPQNIFIEYLFTACQQGHLAVRIRDNDLYPRVEELVDRSIYESKHQDHCFWQSLKNAILDSYTKLPDKLIEKLDPLSLQASESPLIQVGDTVYFSKFYMQESSVIENYNTTLILEATRSINPLLFNQIAQRYYEQQLLTPEQYQLILSSLDKSISFFVGGPGTGKTYTAGLYLRAVLDSLSDQTTPYKVSIAAPTGKAAQQLMASIALHIDAAPPCVYLDKPKTIHSLLNLSSSKRDYLSCDLLIIDECSMLDLRMFSALFSSIKPGSRVLFLGDSNQLPAIESGSLFADLYALYSRYYPDVPLLKKCMRAESLDIVECARAANEGLYDQLLKKINASTYITLYSFPKLNSKILPACIRESFDNQDIKSGLTSTPEKALEAMKKIKILCPFKEGFLGVNDINQALVYEAAEKWKVKYLPIVITENNHSLGIYNGDVGVVSVDRSKCFFEGRDSGSVREIAQALVPDYEMGFALSIHKSQGSEFEHVIITFPPEGSIFGRELIYTALTRAKKKLTLIADLDALKKSLQVRSYRYSGLLSRTKL